MTAIHDISATDLLAAYKSKKLSPVEVVDAVIGHIDQWEPRIKALYAPDFGSARKAAAESEKRWQKGAPAGVLDGVPITVHRVPNVAGDDGKGSPYRYLMDPMTQHRLELYYYMFLKILFQILNQLIRPE